MNKKPTREGIVLAIVIMALLIACKAHSRTVGDSSVMQESLPLIDRSVPKVTQTATFAMG